MKKPTEKKKKRAWPHPKCAGGCGERVPRKQAVLDSDGNWRHLSCQGGK